MLRAAVIGLAGLALAACADRTAERYADYADYAVLTGGLRTERAPADAPFTNADLASNFAKIALNREYRRDDDGALIEETTPSRISRWTEPVRYQIVGAGATPEDWVAYADLAARLSALTGIEVSETTEDPNISILILTAAEREEFVRQLEVNGTAKSWPLILRWADEITYPCVGQVGYRDGGDTGRITGALIVIKAELTGVLRESCIHEELVQTMGLMNDDSTVRPSIFNDDQEFALLTEHDEFLLRILYDARLRAGMEAEEASRRIPEIVADIRPDEG